MLEAEGTHPEAPAVGLRLALRFFCPAVGALPPSPRFLAFSWPEKMSFSELSSADSRRESSGPARVLRVSWRTPPRENAVRTKSARCSRTQRTRTTVSESDIRIV